MSLGALLASRRGTLIRLSFWALILACCTAAYGALAGPALRAVFGGTALAWPSWLVPHLPPPPTIQELRETLPYLIVGVAVAKGIAFHRHTVGLVALAEGVNMEVRGRLHRRLMAARSDGVYALGGGDLISRFMDDVEAVGRLAADGVCGALRDGVQVVALFGLCLALDWRLAVLSFVVYPVAFWPIARLGRRLRRAAGEAQRHRGALVNTLHDQVGRLPAIQLTGRDATAHAQFERASGHFGGTRIDETSVRAFASPFTEVMGALGLALMLVYTGGRIEAGTLAAEHALSFFAALLMMYQPAKGLARLQGIIEPGRAAFVRLLTLWDALVPTDVAVAGRSVPPNLSRLTFDGVSIYRGDRWVLEGVSLRIAPGEWIAIQGPNGAGKSTLVWALGRLLTPSRGQIRIDDVPLDEYDLVQWRKAVGWVTQRPWLSRATVRENVCGDLSLTAEELEALGRETGLNPVIGRLPQGWDTPLGDDGSGLSLGERQRVSLARALAHAPKILVLDEPTSHLDEDGRRLLVDAIEAVRAGRTVIMITHYEDVAARADRIFRLAGGTADREPARTQ